MINEEHVAHHLEDAWQQSEAAALGMWLFLATEIMLFGGIFVAILVLHVVHPEAVEAATHHLHIWLGAANTLLLFTSSLTMVMAVAASREEKRQDVVFWMLITAALGTLFVLLKLYEYYLEYVEGLMPHIGPAFPIDAPAAELFFNLYFASTGLHLFHLVSGIITLLSFAFWVHKRWFGPLLAIRIEMLGLYWCLIDVVWTVLYPSLYLI